MLVPSNCVAATASDGGNRAREVTVTASLIFAVRLRTHSLSQLPLGLIRKIASMTATAASQPHISLPSVLVDEVIDYLKDDPKSLAACSLVCREWVRRSYYHRFERLALSSTSSRRIVSFGRNDTLSYIRMLMIIGDWNTKPEMLRALAILRAQSAPSTLILEAANLITNVSESITTSLPISAVDTLRLSKCNVHKATMVFDVLFTFPKLNRLILHHVKMGQASGVPSSPNPSSQRYTLREPPQLSSIEVASATLAPYLEPFELIASQLKLHSLNLGIVHVPDTRRAGKFVKTCTSLRDLTMTVAFLPSGMFSTFIL